ncbi:MerR family transcriptional regulator [uncultured Enorma sp.]|uniref:MerR family transcriptional regulator n=1 Tax=uncultured Enorma sp. TaxID=1714346 RepID=UPI0028053FA4|nr:MerR family transcriptional regulator [uncultured Enorma sp.]
MKSSRIKDSYTISEVSRLFGIGIDSLRYYERLGIITPARAANGYRIYSLSDMYQLASIKELRELGLRMDTIGTYLEHQSLENTNALIEDELALIDAQMKDLHEKREALESRQRRLETARAAAVGTVFIETMPTRRCVKLSGRLERDEEMDLFISRLHRRYDEQLPLLGTMTVGAFFDRDALAAGRADVFESVFFVIDDDAIPCDFELPAGEYLAYRYRGSYAQDADALRNLAAYRGEPGLCEGAAPFEIYEIDNRDTAREEEFLTRVELRIDSFRTEEGVATQR